jgi:hypothetical protein
MADVSGNRVERALPEVLCEADAVDDIAEGAVAQWLVALRCAIRKAAMLELRYEVAADEPRRPEDRDHYGSTSPAREGVSASDIAPIMPQ